MNNIGMYFNTNKSQCMKTRLVERYTGDDPIFNLGNTILEKVNEYKYLGLVMDSQPTFQMHRSALMNNVNYKLTFFKKIKQYITVEAALKIYKGTILPLMEYADFVFDYGIAYLNKKMQSLKNQGSYIVYNQHHLTYEKKRFYGGSA